MPKRSLLRRGLGVIALSLRAAPREYLIGGLGSALFAGMTVLASVVLGRITDRVILPAIESGATTGAALAGAAGAILGVALLKATGVVGRRYGAYLAQYGLQATFRHRVTRQYLRLPLAWHRRHPTGELLSNANADVEAAFFIAAPLPMAFGAAVMLTITAVLLVVTDPFLAAIGLAVAPAIAAVNWYYQRRMRAAAALAQQARAEVSEIAHESFDAAIVVKTLGREAEETERFAERSRDLRDKLVEVARLRAAFDPLMEALPNLAILAVLLVGAWRVAEGALTAGDLVLFAYLFRLVALPMRVFGWLLGELPRAVVGWERVERVLETAGRMTYGTATAGGTDGAAAAVRDASYLHPVQEHGAGHLADVDPTPGAPMIGDPEGRAHRRGVHDVELDVPAGRTVAVVGATGSGKSTIASLLVRLFDPDAGRVLFDGDDLRRLDRDELARHVAMVFQEPFLFDDTVRGNIDLGGDYGQDEVVRAARLAQADGFIRELPEGYDTRVGERGATLSGGQRQRIALARALVRRPRLLVLDDATSAVDPAVEADILAALGSADLPSTVVVVAYRRGSISLADEVIFVEDGSVAARGRHDDLLATVPAYRRLLTAYELQQQEEAS